MKIASIIEGAGARADSVPTFFVELLTTLEARIEALEGLVNPVPRAGESKPKPNGKPVGDSEEVGG